MIFFYSMQREEFQGYGEVIKKPNKPLHFHFKLLKQVTWKQLNDKFNSNKQRQVFTTLRLSNAVEVPEAAGSSIFSMFS